MQWLSGLAVDASVADPAERAIHIAGILSGASDLGGGTIGGPGTWAFVSRRDTHGAHVWSRAFRIAEAGAAAPDELLPVRVAFDSEPPHLRLTGTVIGPADLGGGLLAGGGGEDAFVLSLDPESGVHLESAVVGTPGPDRGLDVAGFD
jgi:hypothetical protein